MGRSRFIPACAGNSTARAPPAAGGSVHPRVCGELTAGSLGPGAVVGSSPRVRGTRLCGMKGAPFNRFIPACAGNSRVDVVFLHQQVGSSPRVRGTRRHRRLAAAQPRFIPACAGNSSGLRRKNKKLGGSSPRVRGTRHFSLPADGVQRFIPACAGNSTHSNAMAAFLCGSSPRVRGTPGLEGALRALPRFIPACAGNSAPCATSPRRTAVHPRVCGELGDVWEMPLSELGSSPRVRGTRAQRLVLVVDCRFIPACAGNSSDRRHPAQRQPVHPRVCGELANNAVVDARVAGSSPRVRGTRSAGKISRTI